jgi:hypothetical protein
MLAIPSGQHKVVDIKKGQYPHSNSLQFPIYDYYINTGGHMVERGMLDGYPVIRGWDIWKFNSEDYMRKWV